MNIESKIVELDDGNVGVDFVTLADAAKISGYAPGHLNLLCRKGILKGKKFGRNWQTTREWLNEFLYLSGSSEIKHYVRRRKKQKEKLLALAQDELEQIEKKQELVSPSALNKEKEDVSSESFDDENKKKFSFRRMALDFSLAIFVSFFIFFSVSFVRYVRTRDYIAEKNLPENISDGSFLSLDNSGRVAGEEQVKAAASEGEVQTEGNLNSIATSENFKLKEISFGGVLLASASGENLRIEISDVTSEVFTTKDGKQAEILISWKTNKPVISEIEYSKSDIYNPKTLAEKDYGFNHSVVLSKLDLAVTYVYQIKARDRWGNEISSERFGIYSGSKMVSVFDLIFKAINETFGWVMKK